jgi:hypothetical protein
MTKLKKLKADSEMRLMVDGRVQTFVSIEREGFCAGGGVALVHKRLGADYIPRILAIPDLLAACEQGARIEGDIEGVMDGPSLLKLAADICDNADIAHALRCKAAAERAAIAKAKGE